MAIDVSNLNRLKGSIYEKFKDIPESKLNYIKTNLNPHGFVDNIFYYFFSAFSKFLSVKITLHSSQ